MLQNILRKKLNRMRATLWPTLRSTIFNIHWITDRYWIGSPHKTLWILLISVGSLIASNRYWGDHTPPEQQEEIQSFRNNHVASGNQWLLSSAQSMVAEQSLECYLKLSCCFWSNDMQFGLKLKARNLSFQTHPLLQHECGGEHFSGNILWSSGLVPLHDLDVPSTMWGKHVNNIWTMSCQDQANMDCKSSGSRISLLRWCEVRWQVQETGRDQQTSNMKWTVCNHPTTSNHKWW